MEKKCKGCIHWRKLGGTYGERVCNYFFDTGKLRGGTAVRRGFPTLRRCREWKK